MRSLLYLHGFGSSPLSDKPQALAKLLEPHGIAVDAPDLNVPSLEELDFETIVKTAIASARARPPAAIVGSSLGSAIALEVIRRGVRAPTVLIAPAIGISDLWTSRLPAGDPISVMSYARGEYVDIHRAFFEQMGRFDADRWPPPVSVAIFMGTDDESIPFERVSAVWRRWESSGGLGEGSELITIERGDHRLAGEIGRIAQQVLRFTRPVRASTGDTSG